MKTATSPAYSGEHRAHWRLIDTGPLDGPTNMAVDEALLLNFDPERSAPVLRLYGWDPPALSLGRFQDAHDVLDLARCAERKVPVVRRITGGGVIFHADELTYSIVCAPHQIPPAASVKESFRLLTAFLLCFYDKLGLSARYAVDSAPTGARLGERTAFCFAGRESYDILAGGGKIGGNAQRRLKNAIFQHGSIPLVDRAGEGACFLRQKPVGIESATFSIAAAGIHAAAGELKPLIAQAFAEALHVRLAASCLSNAEECSIATLLENKYRDERWNLGEPGGEQPPK